MSDKVYLGSRLVDMAAGEPLLPVSKVILNVDSETCYISGDDSGSVIEQDCPWATQAMADSVLARLKGFVYRPFDGSSAILDPTVEMGDGITVGGIYTVIASMGRTFDPLFTATIGAPGSEELEDEYPYETKERKQTNRELARAYSLISKTAEEIRMEVNGLNGKYTALAVTIDGVTVTDSTGTTKIKGSSIETSTLKVNAANITGTLTVGNLPAGVAMTSDIPSDYEITVITNNAIRTASISANQVTAGTFTGATLSLTGLLTLVYGATDYGYVGASTAGQTAGAVLTDSTKSNFFIATNTGARMSYGAVNEIFCSSSGCYSTSEMKVWSDSRMKNSISYDLSKEEAMFSLIKPCSFIYNRDKHNKVEWGFVAQDLVACAESAGLDVERLSFISVDDDGMYAVAKGGVIALNTYMIQRLMERVSALEAKG